MSIRTALAQLLGDAGPTIVVEGRHCRMTVTPDALVKRINDVELSCDTVVRWE